MTIAPSFTASATDIIFETVNPTETAWVSTPRPSSTLAPSLTPTGTPQAVVRSWVVCRKVVESRWSEYLLCKVLGGR